MRATKSKRNKGILSLSFLNLLSGVLSAQVLSTTSLLKWYIKLTLQRVHWDKAQHTLRWTEMWPSESLCFVAFSCIWPDTEKIDKHYHYRTNLPCAIFFVPLCHIQMRSHLVKGRSPETNLLLDDSMLTYTLLLAIHCTDECFNYKSTHFELHLFIATIHCHEWNILFILKGADQTADSMQAIKKEKRGRKKLVLIC